MARFLGSENTLHSFAGTEKYTSTAINGKDDDYDNDDDDDDDSVIVGDMATTGRR